MTKASERRAATTPVSSHRVREGGPSSPRRDVLATEEPLEIRLSAGAVDRSAALTMRTPGNDFELAAGFLYAEGILTGKQDLFGVRYCQPPDEQQYNVVTVDLRGPMPALGSLERNFPGTSACGICGKASLDQLEEVGGPPPGEGPVLTRETLLELPKTMAAAQKLFGKTGGVHAAGLFDSHGSLVSLREDVGRHNAMDKLIGWALLAEKLPLTDHAVLVSGRASFELLQKAVRAGVGMFCAVSAPSSLAVEVAERFGVTLVGFLREDGFTVYTGRSRIVDV